MSRLTWRIAGSLVLVFSVALVAMACGSPATPTPAATAAAATATPVPTTVPTLPVVPTATAEPQGPKVGGTLVVVAGSPDSLDPHVAVSEEAIRVMRIVGGCPMILGENSKLLPYLAESWKVSADGLTVDMTLKKGIKFHDGTPLTAADYVWTIDRVLSPTIKLGGMSGLREAVSSVEKTDDLSFRMHLTQSSYTQLLQATRGNWMPLSQAFVEKTGERMRVEINGAGPYMLKEFKPDDSMILERNPDFTWGPKEIANGGPWYFDRIVFRYVMEEATVIAGLEAGEINLSRFLPKDLSRFQDGGKFNVLETPGAGMYPFLAMNMSRAPFDDVRVRQAINLAVDRDTLVKVVLQGHGIPQYGPVSSVTAGYWPGVEQIGYHFDLPQAKALMKDAGWIDADGDGILDKDGKPLKVTLKTLGAADWFGPVEILQQQFKSLGMDVEIQLQEAGVLIGAVFGADYDMSIFGFVGEDVELMSAAMHSTLGMNPVRASDPQLDELLDKVRETVDPQARQEYANQAQKLAVEKAYMCPLYAKLTFAAIDKRIQGVFKLGGGDSDFGILIGTGYFD